MSEPQTPYQSGRTPEGTALAAQRLAPVLGSLLAEIGVSLQQPAYPIAIHVFLDRTGRSMGSLTVLELLDLSRGGDGLALNIPNIEP